MRCHACGKNSIDGEYSYRSVTADAGTPSVKALATKFEPYWICSECAAYRRSTRRLVYWLAAVLAILCLIALVVIWFMP